LSTEPKYSESELIQLLKSRNNEAFKYLYLHYRGALYNNILQTIENTDKAGDILQEVFVQIWKNIEKYDESKGRLFTWLVKLTRNITIDQLRIKNYKVHSKNESLDVYVTTVEQNNLQHIPINHIGLRKQVHRLKPELKDVIELAYFQGYNQEEVATILSIPVGTVKTRLRNAIIELRKEFL
jgi:RNA polymerase sigma factor (sigma-70 family)